MSISATSIVAMLELNTQPFANGLESARQQLTTFNDNTQTAGTRVSALGGVATSTGSVLTKSLTVPLLGAGGLATKFAMDYEDSLTKVSTVADNTVVSMDSLSGSVMTLSNDTGIAATDLNEALYNTISAGVDTGDSIDFLSTATKLAKGGFTTTDSAIDALTTTINAYGLEAEDATRLSDLFITSQNLGKLTVDELSGTIGQVIPIASAYGVSVDQLCAGYTELTNNGISCNESSTKLKAMIDELGASGSTTSDIIKSKTGKSFQELMESGSSLGDIMSVLQEYCGETGLSMSDLFSSTEASSAAMILGKNNGEDFNQTLEDLGNSAGAADEAFEKVSDTTQEKFKKALNELKNAGINLGKQLLPVVTKIVKGISNLISEFDGLDDGTKKIITTTGLVIATAGPLLIIGGKIATGIGSIMSLVNTLIPAIGGSGLTGMITGLSAVALPLIATATALGVGFYAWHESVDAGNQSLTVSSEEMSFMERAMAKLKGETVYSKDELKKMGLVYEDFNENISEEFQDKVEEMTTDIHDFGMTLGEVNVDGVITEEEANELVSRVDTALQSCVSAIDAKKEEINSGLTEAFNTDGVIDESETALLEYWNSRGDKEKEEAQTLQTEINNIINTARTEGRKLTQEEVDAIEEYYAQIKQIELEAQADNSYEIEYAQKEFQNRITTLDGENAEKLLGERQEQYEEQNIQTQTNYDTLIAKAKENYDTLSAEDKVQVDDTIRRLEEAKEEELRINQEKYDADVQYAEEHNKNLTNIFNKFTGEMVEREDEDNYKSYLSMLDHYRGIEGITKSGYQKVYDTATGSWKDLYVSIDETTGQLKGVYDLNTTTIQSMSDEDEKALQEEVEAWNLTTDGIIADCLVLGGAYVDASGQIKNASGEVIGNLKEVTDENGNVIESILEINGNEIKIEGNWRETINKANEVSKAIQEIKSKTITISVNQVGYANVKGSGYTTMYATGTENALSGVAEVAEYGPELILGNNGISTLATGRQVVDMEGGETVYNARQTKEIIKGMENKGDNNYGGFNLLAEKIDILTKTTDSLKINMNNIANKVEQKEFKGDVVLDSRKVGEAIFPTISNTLANERSFTR